MPREAVKAALRELYYRTPDWLQRAALVKRRERIWLSAGIIFIHIPKAAGTSINETLFGRFMGHVHAADVQRWGTAALEDLPSFAVTRNPWDRLVSAYRFARIGRGVGGQVQAGVRNPEQYRVPQFETFETFVRDWLANRDIAALDPIFQPQWPFVCDRDGHVLVDHLGQVEKLADTEEFVSASIGRPVKFGRSNRSGDPLDYRNFFTSELADLAGTIYRRDVDMFGYRF